MQYIPSNAFVPYIDTPGLILYVNGGRAVIGGSTTAFPSTTITLLPNRTTYVYLDVAGGLITSNNTAFPANCYSIAIVTTDNGTITSLSDLRPDVPAGAGGGGTAAFGAITTGTNTAATMTVGTGATIQPTGSGIINSTAIGGVSITGTPTAGKIPIASSGTAAAWGDPLCQGIQATGTAAASINPILVSGSDGTNQRNLATDTTGHLIPADAMTGTVPGTAPGATGIVGAIYNAAAPTPSTGQTLPLQTDASGNLKVNVAAGGTAGTQYAQGSTVVTPTGTVAMTQGPTNVLNSAKADASGNLLTSDANLVAQASATSGEKGPLVQGAVTTGAPTYTTAQTDPLSLTTAGGLRCDASSVAGTALGAPANFGTSPGAVVAGSANASLFVGTTAVSASAAVPVSGIGPVTPGAVAANSELIGTQYNTAAPSPTAAQQVAVQCDAKGNLKMTGAGNAFNHNQVACTTSSTLILAANTARLRATITNTGTTAVYIGNTGVTIGTGHYMAGTAGYPLVVKSTAAIYGVVGSGSQTVSYLEEVA